MHAHIAVPKSMNSDRQVKALLEGVPGLACVETVDSTKLASKLDTTVAALGRPPLRVMVQARARSALRFWTRRGWRTVTLCVPAHLQVNTSGEESKYGVDPGEATVALASHIARECPNLCLAGLMTIGMPDYSSRPENFACLAECRRQVRRPVGGSCMTSGQQWRGLWQLRWRPSHLPPASPIR